MIIANFNFFVDISKINMKKNITLFVIGSLLFIGSVILGVHNSHLDFKRGSQELAPFSNAIDALDQYSYHNKVLKSLESNNITSAIELSKKYADLNNKTMKACFDSKECKQRIESERIKNELGNLDK